MTDTPAASGDVSPSIDRGGAGARSQDRLRAIVARLLGPGGCPWDREQTHESLRPHLIEEAYEAAEAIDRGDLAALREELGDLLMQVYFHAAIAEAAGAFALEDVIGGVADKLVRRHPHVFGDADAGAPDEIWARWDAIKAAERAADGGDGARASPFASLPAALPALQRAQSVQGRAARAGLGGAPDGAEAALAAVAEAASALGAAAEDERDERLGALLWAAAAFARAAGLDAESVLRERTARFVAAAEAAPGGG